jgi:hypothetical protein
MAQEGMEPGSVQAPKSMINIILEIRRGKSVVTVTTWEHIKPAATNSRLTMGPAPKNHADRPAWCEFWGKTDIPCGNILAMPKGNASYQVLHHANPGNAME